MATKRCMETGKVRDEPIKMPPTTNMANYSKNLLLLTICHMHLGQAGAIIDAVKDDARDGDMLSWKDFMEWKDKRPRINGLIQDILSPAPTKIVWTFPYGLAVRVRKIKKDKGDQYRYWYMRSIEGERYVEEHEPMRHDGLFSITRTANETRWASHEEIESYVLPEQWPIINKIRARWGYDGD